MPEKSNRQKGNEFQRWIRDWLQEKGWVVHNQTPMGRMVFKGGKKFFISQRNDIFGCDLICKKMNKTLWIQCTMDGHKGRKLEELLKYPWSLSDDVQVWMKRKDGSIDIFRVDMQPAGDFEPIGKIIRRKLYCTEGIIYGY